MLFFKGCKYISIRLECQEEQILKFSMDLKPDLRIQASNCIYKLFLENKFFRFHKITGFQLIEIYTTTYRRAES